MFEKRNPDQTQKKIKCKVLINYDEVREMTLGELMEFMEELEEGTRFQCDIPIEFECEELADKIPPTVNTNQQSLGIFLSYLYCVYRKIEMKMQTAGYPDVIPDSNSKKKSLNYILANIDTARDNYIHMDKNDFLATYPVLKKLFFCYTDYVRYSVDHGIDVNEGKYFPGSVDEMKAWLVKLNTWHPTKVKAKQLTSTNSIIETPDGFDSVIEALQKTTKFGKCTVIKNTTAAEPCIVDENNERILFGFINMKRAERADVPQDSIVFESECPDGCTKDVRKWICSKCGDFVRIKINSTGKPFLFCSCGSEKYREKLFICHHPSHRIQK